MTTHLEKRDRRRRMAKAIKNGDEIELVAYRFSVTECTVRNACRECKVKIKRKVAKRPRLKTEVMEQIELMRAENEIGKDTEPTRCDTCGYSWVFKPWNGWTTCEICRSIKNVKKQIQERIDQANAQSQAIERLEGIQRLAACHWANSSQEDPKVEDQRSAIQSASSDEARGRRMGKTESILAGV